MQQVNEADGLFFCVATLAVWRLTHLLHAEDGPFDVFVRLRRGAGEGFFGKLLDCFHCDAPRRAAVALLRTVKAPR